MQRRKFSREFKLEAVKLVRDRGVTDAQAARDAALSRSKGRVRSYGLIVDRRKPQFSAVFERRHQLLERIGAHRKPKVTPGLPPQF